MLNVLRVLMAVAVSAALACAAAAQDSPLSKSISSGWKSVVKDASKAAKSVTKAANDALAPQKPRRKKSAKRKSEPKSVDDTKATGDKTEPGASSAATATVEEEGPPVPLTPPATKPAPPETPKGAKLPTPATKSVVKRDPGPARRLPAPPTPVKPSDPDGGWTAAKSTDDDGAIPQADVVPLKQDPGKDGPRNNPLPITMIPPKAGTDAEAAANTWSKEEIETAKTNCAALLQGIDAVTIPEAPVREGSCGAPAPVRLVSIGKNPAITLSPQPLVTCELVAGLSQWMNLDIQPLAKKHFGEPIVKIETMSDYSCRMAYGRKGNKLSEHGRANALDIRGFVTGKGQTAYVLEAWGKTARDRAAEAAALAAENTAAEKATEAAAAAGAKSAMDQRPSPSGVGLPALRSSTTAHASLTGPALKPPPPLKPSVTESEKTAALIVPEAPHSKPAQFLRDAHASACRIFGTSLGPESNEAHRNHFHVDMAHRKHKKICD